MEDKEEDAPYVLMQGEKWRLSNPGPYIRIFRIAQPHDMTLRHQAFRLSDPIGCPLNILTDVLFINQ
jgi:hypothetical protein